MTGWIRTESVKYGVAITKFEGSNLYCLPLELGEAVLIYEQSLNGEWCRGCTLMNRSIKGIFPASIVHVKDWSIETNRTETTELEIASSKELSVVLEVTSVLREWGAIWKQCFVRKEENKIETLKKAMIDLMNWRRQIMSGALTGDQLKKVKLDIANKIDFGNKFLGLDLVVRDNDGNVIDVENTGFIELYKRHLESSQRTQTPSIQSRRKSRHGLQASPFLQYNSHNLYVSIKNVVCKIGDDSEVYITLYDGRDNCFISEHFLVLWDKQGMPKDIEKLHNLSCLFTDLGSQDLQRDKLYIVCQIIRDGKMDIKDTDNRRFTQQLRRPFAIAVLYVSDILQDSHDDEEDKERFLPLQLVASDEFQDTLIKKTIARTPSGTASGQGIWLTVQMLHGDLQQVREEHPLLINQFTAIARKQGFPDVIMPGDVRNDMYINLISGSFERGNKSANKNIQVSLGVYDSDGKLMQDVIQPGAGESYINEFYSTVYYHCANPKWTEVVKLSMPVERVHGSHIRFVFRHRATVEEKDKSQKIFALCYVNLKNNNGTCLQDGPHELAVYKCDMKRIDDCSVYLSLPSTKEEVQALGVKKHIGSNGLSISKNETFLIDFQLCSTKLAQNVDLLGLLSWRLDKERLATILPALMNVKGQEIVKFLGDTFDALFSILTEDPNRYGEMVSDAVVFCIGLLADKKYHQFRSILDAYISSIFSSTKAYITLIDVLQRNIEEAMTPSLSPKKREHIIKYYKALEYLMKFIVKSRSLSERAAPGKAHIEFEGSVNSLFASINKMMKMSQSDVLPLQGCALKYVPAAFSDLLEVYDATQLGYFARDLIERIPPGLLLTQKLTSIHQMVKGPLFTVPDSRLVLLPMVISQLNANLEKCEELRICADIMNEMLSCFYNTPEVGDTDDDIAYIVTCLFRTVIKTLIRMDRSIPLAGNYVAFVVCILDLMKNEHYQRYIESYPNDTELADCLMELFLVFREFIKTSVYPSDWISMTMIQNHVLLRALQYFSEALYDKFLVGDSFKYQLWNNFFELAVLFIIQDSLQLENFSTAKRNKIIEKYHDMRLDIGLKVVDMWQWLGINKIKLIPGIVPQFLEMTLIPETELRKATIHVFFDMIECEFRNRQHFRQVESEVISQLDVLIESGKGDEEYKDLFCEILSTKFKQEEVHNPRLCEVGMIFVETITKLLSRLLDYRYVTEADDNINNKMSCTVNILNFYQLIRREEMYIRYLYKLCDLHISVENYTEAAFTLLLHAELLKWSDESLGTTHNVRYQATTHRELKEILYKDIIDHFDKGKMWEYGISRCKELANQYESETYDYIQLSYILERQAKFFENIIKKLIRPEPTYFRVGYYGRGFPTFLRNKLFIYRGDDYEQLSDFRMRLRSQFPGAQFLNTLEAPGTEVTDSIGQSIQVCKVDPKPVERRKFQGRSIADQIKKFYEVNDVSEFTLSRPFHKGKKDKDNEFATLWVEKTSMNTEYSFPGKLRWFEVTNQSKVEISPIQNACDTLVSKNKELRLLINQIKADKDANLNPLSMALNGVIDAAVMGGITNYEKIFFCEAYLSEHPEDVPITQKMKELIVEQVDILEDGLSIHKQRITESLRPFHEKMEKQFKETKAKVSPYRKSYQSRQGPCPSREVRPDSIVIHKLSGGRISTESLEKMRPRGSVLSTGSVLSAGALSTGALSPPPLPGKRATMLPQSSSLQPSPPPIPDKGKQDKGNRHTTIIGVNPLVDNMISSQGPMLDRGNRRATLIGTSPNRPPTVPAKSPSTTSRASTISQLSTSSYDDVSGTLSDYVDPVSVPKRRPAVPLPYESPTPPPKPERIAQTPPIVSTQENVTEFNDDDDAPPPPPPPKKVQTLLYEKKTSEHFPETREEIKLSEDSSEIPPEIPSKSRVGGNSEKALSKTDFEADDDAPPVPPREKQI